MGYRRRARYSYYSNPNYTAGLLLCFAWGLGAFLIAGTYGLIPGTLAIVLPTLAVIAHGSLPD